MDELNNSKNANVPDDGHRDGKAKERLSEMNSLNLQGSNDNCDGKPSPTKPKKFSFSLHKKQTEDSDKQSSPPSPRLSPSPDLDVPIPMLGPFSNATDVDGKNSYLRRSSSPLEVQSNYHYANHGYIKDVRAQLRNG